MSEDAIWFYELNGERKGPISERDLQSLAGNGTVRRMTLVWSDGMGDWKPIEETELGERLTFSQLAMPPAVPIQYAAVRVAHVPRAAKLREDFTPGIRECFGQAWSQMKLDFWPYVGLFALSTLLVSVASQLYLPIFFLMYPIMVGFSWYVLCRRRGVPVSVDAIFEGFRRQFGPLAVINLVLVGLTLILTLLFAGAVIAIVIGGGAAIGGMDASSAESPLVAVSLGLAAMVGSLVLMFLFSLLAAVGNFATILALDCELSGGDSLRLAWQATRKHWFKIAIFCVAANFLTIAGSLAFYVGMFVTGAWSAVAMVYLYLQAFGDDSDQGAMT